MRPSIEGTSKHVTLTMMLVADATRPCEARHSGTSNPQPARPSTPMLSFLSTWSRFVVSMGLIALCILLVGARDLSDALQDGTSTRPAVETLVAGLIFAAMLGGALAVKRRRSRRRASGAPAARGLDGSARGTGATGAAVVGEAARDRYDDKLDDELSRL